MPLLVGLGALCASTLLLCLGRGLVVLVVGRALQGVSAAVVWTVGLALLVDTVGRGRVGEAMGYVALAMSFAVLVAPLLGGVVYARAGYWAVFCMAFGLIGVDVVLRVVLVEKKVARRWDVPAVDGEQMGEKPLSGSDGVRGPSEEDLDTLPSAIAVFPSNGRSTKGRNSIVLFLSSRRLLAALYCTLTQSILLTAWDAVLPLYVHRIWGWSSIGAGLIFLPLITPSFLSPLFGFWSDRKGPRIPTTLGFLFAIPFLVLMRLVDHDSIQQKALICAMLACLGFALSMALTPLLAEITYVVGHKEESHPGAFGGKGAYAMAYGLFNMAFAGGMLIGPIWGGFVTQGKGWSTMCWTLAVLSISGAVVAELWVGGWVGKSGKEAREKEVEVRNSGRDEV